MHVEITRKIFFRYLWCEKCNTDENFHAIQYLSTHTIENILFVAFEHICCECNKCDELIKPKKEVVAWNDWNCLVNRVDIFA